MRILHQVVASPYGVFCLLLIAAFLEVFGDSCFQSALHRSSGITRAGFFAEGAAVLALYGLVVNLPGWDFGKLLGVYVALFFLAAQIVARLRFHQPTLPVFVGGAFIVTGGLIISFWKV